MGHRAEKCAGQRMKVNLKVNFCFGQNNFSTMTTKYNICGSKVLTSCKNTNLWHSQLSRHYRCFQSTAWSPLPRELQTPTEIEEYLSKPSWSVKDLICTQEQAKESQISREKLHHLLRLSALPLPASDTDESQMIKDLGSQLQFVHAVQNIDTKDVEPSQSIRDETKQAREANTIGVANVQKYLDNEIISGKRGRIRKTKANNPRRHTPDGQDLLLQAPKKIGKYVIVDTAKD